MNINSLIAATLIVVFPGAALASEFHVSISGDDTNAGTR
jgi:hypothetical protein